MYSITKYTKKADLSGYDYVFKKFDEMYRTIDYLYLPLVGVYKVAIITTDTKAVNDFISNEDKYKHINVHFLMEEQAIQVIENSNPEANFEDTVNSYSIFNDMITSRKLLFDKYMIYKLYRSIDHDTASMMNALDKIVDTYKVGELLTEEKLSKIFVLNDIVYPSQVLLKFINMDNNRWSLFRKCIMQIDNDVLVGSVVKELRKLVSAKAAYFRSGDAPDRIKQLNTQNLMMAYRVFISGRTSINDAYLLFKFYESGVSAVDIRGGQNVSI